MSSSVNWFPPQNNDSSFVFSLTSNPVNSPVKPSELQTNFLSSLNPANEISPQSFLFFQLILVTLFSP